MRRNILFLAAGLKQTFIFILEKKAFPENVLDTQVGISQGESWPVLQEAACDS